MPDYVFIDEAAQADELETLQALVFHYEKTTKARIILAGDPKQLGPVIFHKKADELGLGTSLLERMMAIQPYQRDETTLKYNPERVVMLTKNYRSHPRLLDVPSELFYHKALEACASDCMRVAGDTTGFLPNPHVPLLVLGVMGKHQQEANSPSYFNADEVIAVRDVVIRILELKGAGLTSADIGIISPYMRQVGKIRHALKAAGVNDVRVGTVESFQGGERQVIVLSTVRSMSYAQFEDIRRDLNAEEEEAAESVEGGPDEAGFAQRGSARLLDFLPFDMQHGLGFLHSAKRFNVAITRAKSLLVVVGNPHVLKIDPNWRRLIDFAVANGCTRGAGFNLSDELSTAFEEAYERLKMDEVLERDRDSELEDECDGGGVTANVVMRREDE
jgi:helicase MOV-10